MNEIFNHIASQSMYDNDIHHVILINPLLRRCVYLTIQKLVLNEMPFFEQGISLIVA